MPNPIGHVLLCNELFDQIGLHVLKVRKPTILAVLGISKCIIFYLACQIIWDWYTLANPS
jgi:hypothetical protein